MSQRNNEYLTIKVNQSHIEAINRAAGHGKVNYSAAIRHAIENTYGEYGQKKAG